ncbi:basic helix-loop-helix domain-containing protein [Aspergillus mulundensis]|uniref:Putative bHLH transcription factor n=1 Tax=Aspergillus mulundensis TaxID=1810919 RepID=A0A3D8RKB0_9EURO|nr:putative bHLH transcription factor [Aspergillus mulundensis]RDW74410.1 putative bHLH transcription factor [Aspergillus mulundensis]
MEAPSIGTDFQLFSPAHSRGRKSSQGDSGSDDAGQDWNEWMRWDEQAFPDSKNLPLSPSLTSPPFSDGKQGIDLFPTGDFSPDVPLDCTNISFDAFPTQDSSGVLPTPNFFQDGMDTFTANSVVSGSPLSTVAGQKRKSGSDDDGSAGSGVVQEVKKVPSKKRAHNVIEKRYRANLNEKIAELRDSVPSLRASKGSGGLADDEDEGVTPANKLNKASILSKATDYIKHLEIRNKRLEDENTALKIRLRELEKAADQSLTSAASVSSPSNYTVSTESGGSSSPSIFSNPEDSPIEPSPSSSRPAAGMIQMPDSFKRMRSEQPKDNLWSQSYMQYPSSSSGSAQSGNGRRRSYYPNKYVLGTLAGLMVFEGLGKEKETDSTAKGLLALPFNYFRNVEVPPVLYETMGRSFWSSWHAKAILHFLFLAVLVVGSAFIVFVYLFNSGPGHQSSSKVSTTNVMLSSSNFRRQAWLTSIQRVGVPRHRFFHEWYVVTSRCFEYVLRCLLGWKLYSSITGITAEDEKGRVKTWDIAIDAQLSGGDAEISKSRLVLTIFAAGTLPRSPMRMMLKALHCRILLWRVGVPGQWSYQVSNDVARSLAKYQWDLARKKNAALPKDHEDALPSHLKALLKCECEDVMIDSIIQRAANLTWNDPTQEGSDGDDAFLDVVEEDPAIQSSLDALAAWWSSHLLQRALLRYFEASARGPDAKKSRDLFKAKIQLALDVAPQPSAAHTRALVMMAVFFEQDRVENIGAVLAALPKEKSKSTQNSTFNFLDSSLPVSVREEISIAVRCAMIAAIFTARSRHETSLPESFTMEKAVTWFDQLPLDPVDLTLLGFSAVYHLLHVLASDTGYLSSSDSSRPSSPMLKDSLGDSSDDAEDEADEPATFKKGAPEPVPLIGRVASELMYWARNAYNPTFYGFTSDLVQVIEEECTSLCRGAGVDVADYARLHQQRLKASHRKDKQKNKSRSSREHITPPAEAHRDTKSTTSIKSSESRHAQKDQPTRAKSTETGMERT